MHTDSVKLGTVFFDQILRRDCYQIRRWIDNPPDVVIDIGGNMGMFSIVARALFPYATIHTIEPCPTTYDNLAHNLNFFNCVLHRAALSHHSAVTIRPGRDSGSNSTRSAAETIKEGDAAETIPGHTLAQFFDEFGVDPQRSRVLLKVDCEGAERVIIEDRRSEEAMLSCIQASLEMHYCDGRGSYKWADAISRADAEAWIAGLVASDVGSVSYAPDRLGGMLVVRP